MKRCTILSGGPYYPDAKVAAGDFVIACDQGYAHAAAAGIKPDLVVGDFDSYHGKVDANLPTILLPTVKNDTDTGYALRYAVEHGYDDIVIHYALGARLDHTVANLQNATSAAEKGAFVTLLGDGQEVHVFSHGDVTLSVRADTALSVLSLTDVCTDVCIEGAFYRLDHATIRNDFPLGVSNTADGEVKISLDKGVLFVSLAKA